MAIINRRAVLILSALLALAAIMLATATVLATGGDYGVNTGAAAQSGCGSTGQPACTLNWSGYALTYQSTRSDGTHVYTFDDFDCTVYIHRNGNTSGRGPECDQYQP